MNCKLYILIFIFFSVSNLNKIHCSQLQNNSAYKIITKSIYSNLNQDLINKLDSNALGNIKLSENYIDSIEKKLFLPKANNFFLIGYYYYTLSKFDESMSYFNKALDFHQQKNDTINILNCYRFLEYIHFKKADYLTAKKYLQLYIQYKDPTYAQTLNKSIQDIQDKYDIRRKQQKIDRLIQEYNNQNIEIIKIRFVLTGLILVLISMIILVSVYYIKSKIFINQKLLKISQLGLKQQMNPHFVFNTLNSIQYYLYQNEKEKSENYLSMFSKLLNRILESSNNEAITIHEEIENLKLYLELEKLRFKEKFSFTIEADNNIDIFENKVPMFLIQPFVENAILHGIMPLENKGKVSIRFELDYDTMSCIIEDNGIGREKAMEIKKTKNHKSLATKISENRIEILNLLYNNELKINYTDLKDSQANALGTLVEITFPIIN